ncbi:hypothetical protein NEIRO03_2172 [Nematocida sp. AWRm78]|nr:hypothetical protein NEIRO02_2212 [Nematocida sp. AWRm79]KAI5185997.1 hypothetical protein NEIRO03_2172 [Nematocida sp. AWRm78]
MDGHGLNIFHLSNRIESIAPIKIQVVLGLGSGLFGAAYSGMFHFKKNHLIKTTLTLFCAFILYIAYLFMLRLYVYRPLDIIIFLLAVHTRALKSIIAATDAAKKATQIKKTTNVISPQVKPKILEPKKTKKSILKLILFPTKTTTPIPFDKIFEELVFRLLIVSNIHIIYRLQSIDVYILAKGVLYASLSYIIRYAEYKLTKTTPPGVINQDGYNIYAWFIYSLLITEMYTK